MNKGAWGHGFSVALWAAIGTLIAISVVPLFWWVGLLAGSAGAYLATDFRQIRSAAATAWQTAGGWKPPKRHWWIPRLQQAFLGANMGTCLMPIAIIVVYLLRVDMAPATIGIGIFCILFPGILGFLYQPVEPVEKIDWITGLKSSGISVYGYYIPRYAVPWLLRWLGRRLGRWFTEFATNASRFTKTLFLLIHSQKRVLRAMDTLFGVGAGLLLGENLAAVLLAGAAGFFVGGLPLGARVGTATQSYPQW